MHHAFLAVLLIDETPFFIYIGFSIATFAFLCNYLIFPKSLLSDLSNLKRSEPPGIVYQKYVNKESDELRAILSFFFEIDLVTYTILAYIPYSVLAVLILDLIFRHLVTVPVGKILLVVLSLWYEVAISGLLWVIHKDKGLRKKDHWGAKGKYIAAEVVISIIFLLGSNFIVLFNNNFSWPLFVFLIFFLMVLFVWYLVPIAFRVPVSNMLRIWFGIAGDDCE